jgi:hypothetical protein
VKSINQLSRALPLIPLVVAYCGIVSCQHLTYTTDPNSRVVKFQHELIDLAKGEKDEIEGITGEGEAYILMYGYERPLEDLPISEGLKEALAAIRPRPTEMYVLALAKGDYIREYTDWEITNEQNDHPLIWPMPIIISGDPFKITVTKRQAHSVDIRIE